MQKLIEALCSTECAGRAAGSPGGAQARRLLVEAFTGLGLAVEEQAVPGCGGTNLLVPVRGRGAAADRWVLVGAHYDHLGRSAGDTYFGADDNAAAVAMLVELGRALRATPPEGRSVLLVAFDGEEPPHFLSEAMGSAYFCRHPTIPLEAIDLMVCLDLMGHALGDPALPPEVRSSFFVLGAERSEGTGARIDALATAVPGTIARRADVEIVTPMSDYFAFWQAKVPFVFLTCGRWAHYHRPSDTPDRLDHPKIAAMARWLELLTRDAAARPEPAVRFTNAVDDASTLRTLRALLTSMAERSPLAAAGLAQVEQLLSACRPDGTSSHRQAVLKLAREIESALA